MKQIDTFCKKIPLVIVMGVVVFMLTVGTTQQGAAQWTFMFIKGNGNITEFYDSDGNTYRPDPSFKIEFPYYVFLGQRTFPVSGFLDDWGSSLTVGMITVFCNVRMTANGVTETSGFTQMWWWTYATLGTKYLDLTLAYIMDLDDQRTIEGQFPTTNLSDEIRAMAVGKVPLGDFTLYGGIDYFYMLPHQSGPHEVKPGDLFIPLVGVSRDFSLGENTSLGVDISMRYRSFAATQLDGVSQNDHGYQLGILPTFTLSYKNYFVQWLLGGLQDEYQPYGFTLAGENGVSHTSLDFRMHLGVSI